PPLGRFGLEYREGRSAGCTARRRCRCRRPPAVRAGGPGTVLAWECDPPSRQPPPSGLPVGAGCHPVGDGPPPLARLGVRGGGGGYVGRCAAPPRTALTSCPRGRGDPPDIFPPQQSGEHQLPLARDVL